MFGKKNGHANSSNENTPTQILTAELKKNRIKRERKGSLLEIFLTIAFVFIVLRFIFGIAVVDGNSMYPSMRDGDLTIYYRIQENYKVGDVVVIEMPNGEEYVKRVVATAGEEVDIQEGALYVNGAIEKNTPLYETEMEVGEVEVVYPFLVPEGTVFVLGDHRTDSMDSRSFGSIKLSQIRGRVLTLIRMRVL